MNKRFFVPTFIIFSFIFALAACSNIGGEYSESAKGSAILLQAGMGRICGSIDGDGASSKSVVPDTSSILSTGIDSYVVYAWGTKADGTVVPFSSPINGTVANDRSFGMDLEYGTWNIRADALDASGKVLLSKTSEPMPLSESVPVVSLSLSLNFLNDASQPGSLALPLSYSTSVNIAKIDYSLTPSSGAAITGTVTDVSSGSLTLDASLNASFGSLTPGTYSLLVKFLDSDGGTIIRLDQAVQIYSNLTTKKIDGNAPYVTSGAIDITPTVVSRYQSSVIYVGGTGLVSGAAASDANNGSQYDPVASLKRAVSLIENSSLTPADGFTVYLQGNVSLSTGLRITASKKIAFVGTNSSSHYKISAGGNYISKETAALIKFSYIDFDYVNNFELTDGETQFTNCNITNGSSSSNGGGFSVLQSGTKAVLQNCTISDCSASEGLGGGIYVAADSGTAEVQLTNCVIGAASPGTNATDTENSNFATSGGGIFVASGGKATLNNSKVNYNYSSGTNGGGGICSSGTLILTNGSNVGYNASSYSGGGISLLDGVFNSEASSIIYNKALGSSGAGGGLNVANSVSQFKMFGDTIAYNYANNGGGLSTNTTQTAAAQFEGVLLQNNEAANNGGAIQVTTGHYLTLASCDVNTNRAHNYGGGVYCAGTVTMNGTSSISMNTSDSHGGGVYNNKTFKMQAGQIVQNNCCGGEDSYQYGGGIYNAKGASLTIDGGTIGQNNSNRYGGGIYSLGNITMTDGLITANKIDGAANKMLGGANIYIQGYSSTSPVTLEMSDGEIANVSLGTMSTSFSGSVMMGQYSTFNMSGGKIANNDTKGYTAGVYLSSASATFNMTGGSIEKNTATLTLGTPEYGGAIYSIGTVKLSGAASIPAGDADGNTGQGKNDVFLSGVPITIADTLSATAPVATIMPSVYSTTTQVLDGTPALLEANYEKFALTDDPSGGVWAIGNSGVLYQIVEQGGTITIDTPEGALTIAASATEITTSDADTTITLSAENASGTDVTGDLTWALTIYYGSDTTAIATSATNSYDFLSTFPKGTYTINVSVTYNETAYSDNFTITKTVDAGSPSAATGAYTPLPAGTDGCFGTSGTYVTFGLCPKTIKASDVTIDESNSKVSGVYTCCKGSDGYWYISQTERGQGSSYKYSDGTSVGMGGTSSKWFKVEPIKWCVLTDNYSGKKLLLAENVLIGKRYAESSNNYANSEIRAWLNSDFMSSAFNTSQQSLIATTTVDNSAASTTDSGSNIAQATSYACENTSDKIFLLSELEATTSAYGFVSYNVQGLGNTRIRVATDFALACGSNQSTTSGYGGWWWLRSPSSNSASKAAYIDTTGYANVKDTVSSIYGGVVPALCLE